jgi:hypothetical protein
MYFCNRKLIKYDYDESHVPLFMFFAVFTE